MKLEKMSSISNNLIEKIRATLKSDKLVLDSCDLRGLEELIKKQGNKIRFDFEDIEIDSHKLKIVSFVYPKKGIDELLSEVRGGKVHSLEEEYSEHAVQYTDTGPRTAHFRIRRYNVNRIYFPNFKETAFFTKEEFLSWSTEVASFDDPGDIGEGVYESSRDSGIKIYGPLSIQFLENFFTKSPYSIRGVYS